MWSAQDHDLEKLSDDNISQSKYILSSALMEGLRDRNPEDVKALKDVIFWILEQNESMFEPIKYAVVDGRILDAAEQMYLLAERCQTTVSLPTEYCGEIFFKTGILFRPFVSFRALTCFERALGANADSRLCHAELGRIYRYLGDIKRAEKHEKMSMGVIAKSVNLAGTSIENGEAGVPYASNVTLLPITIARDSRKKFSQNLDLE